MKVLDFGLAKLIEQGSGIGDQGSGRAAGDDVATYSPTLSLGATRAGVILGTAAYMAPEQARGKTIDRRADIWAFGCVLYEMLTGRRAFGGEDAGDTLASVLKLDPEWSRLPADVPPALRTLLNRCLEKDPRRRVADISTARFVLDEEGPSRATPHGPASASATATGDKEAGDYVRADVSVWRRVLPWGLAALLGLALLAVLVLQLPGRTAAPTAPVRLEAAIGADASIVNFQASLAVSRDGSLLAFAGQPSQGTQELYVRRLDDLRAMPLAGTAGARHPFFSPDGQWIGFFSGGKLKKIAVTGGAPVTLADAPDDRGGTWTEDGSIVFQPGTTGSGLLRVSSAGGTPAPLTRLGAGEAVHRWPQVLPGGAAVIYNAQHLDRV